VGDACVLVAGVGGVYVDAQQITAYFTLSSTDGDNEEQDRFEMHQSITN